MARVWTLEARPESVPTASDFQLRDMVLPDMSDGMVRVSNRWLSVDPYMRGRMRDVRSYVPPFALGEPMTGGAIGEVVESRADGYTRGDKVLHMQGWRDEAVLRSADLTKLADGIAEQHFLGIAGMPGMTAYFGLLAVAEAEAGNTVFVSASAGAVGSAVVQIAKQKGMTVVGSAGGDEKTRFVRGLGADIVIDYKAERDLAAALMRAVPNGIDAYFDNVGGDHLDAALAAAKDGARFAMCGMIDKYNDNAPTSLRYLMRIVAARIRLRGFIVSDFADRMDQFQRDMTNWLASGAIRPVETIRDGLEGMPDAFNELFTGGNLGKMLVRL